MPTPTPKNPAQRHSRLGIASTLIGGSLPVLLPLLMILGGSGNSRHGTDSSKFFHDAFAYAFVIVGLLAPPLHLTGLILGIIGLRSKNTKKSFAVAGLVLNLVFGLIGVGIIVLLLTNTSWTAFR